MLHGKKEGGQASEILHYTVDSQRQKLKVEGDKELVNRVKKWLEESQPPQLNSARSNKEPHPSTHPLYSHSPKKIDEASEHAPIDTTSASTAHSLEGASNTILYHPDFADWSESCIHHQADTRPQISSMEDMLRVGLRMLQL
jgi:hypothetical protein